MQAVSTAVLSQYARTNTSTNKAYLTFGKELKFMQVGRGTNVVARILCCVHVHIGMHILVCM